MISPPDPSAPLVSLRWRGAASEPPRRLELAAGGSCVLLGPAGSGKSAVIEAIGSAASSAAVQVGLFGVACGPRGGSAALRRRLGMMWQDIRLADDLSVIDNLALAARASGRRLADYRADLLEVLAWVGLRARLFAAAGELDLEGRRRLALARALVNGPEVLIADEPADGLPAKARNGLLRLIGDVHGAGTAVLLATRDPALAAASGGDVTDLGPRRAAELAGAA